jgi:hypothetical protein
VRHVKYLGVIIHERITGIEMIEAKAFRTFIRIYSLFKGSRDSAVGIATAYGLDDTEIGVRVPIGSRIFTSPSRPDRLWGPANLLSNGYQGLFPRG